MKLSNRFIKFEASIFLKVDKASLRYCRWMLFISYKITHRLLVHNCPLSATGALLQRELLLKVPISGEGSVFKLAT